MSTDASVKPTPDSQPAAAPKRRRCPLFEFPPAFWEACKTEQGSDVNLLNSTSNRKSEDSQNAEQSNPSTSPVASDTNKLTVAESATCASCDIKFDSFLQQRSHFRTDWHKYNVQRQARGLPSLTEEEFEDMSDLGSHSSLSGSEDEHENDDDDDNDNDDGAAGGESGKTHVKELSSRPVPAQITGANAEQVEFKHPTQDAFIVVYKAALPDSSSLASFASFGSWCIIMAGGGHFCAALFDSHGSVLAHKTFHRYTSRRKQGGSQAAADEARGNANRIRSAGATLRRYGEQALEKEVHELLRSWRQQLSSVQCVFIRASYREKRVLLFGWEGSPLKELLDQERVRNIPIPTRRATFKETVRVYEVLTTVTISPVSLVQDLDHDSEVREPKSKPTTVHKDSSSSASKPKEKGTDHLKKRDDKPKPDPKLSQPEPKEDEPPIDEGLARLASLCVKGDKSVLQDTLTEVPDLPVTVFGKEYFRGDQRFENVTGPLGPVGIAATISDSGLVGWLLDNGFDPAVGSSPYLATKNKSVRTLLRRYWAKNPDKYDYAKAGIPSPLTDADLQAQAERERAKRKKEKDKKKEKAQAKIEAAKPPEQRARELRAAAAEARMLGNRCASCKKSLEGLVPFERLAYKYCSVECVSDHRQKLNSM